MFSEKPSGFSMRIAAANTVGYFLAVVPPIIVDPKLFHHFRYGARHYTIGWWIVPIGLGVWCGTMFVMVRTRKLRSVLCNSLPLLGGSILTLPFLLPEFPHAFVTTTTVLWCGLSVIATLIHEQPIENGYANDQGIALTARLARAKEEISFWKAVIVALSGGLLAGVISWCNSIVEQNKMVDNEPTELFMLNKIAQFLVTLVILWIILGPILEAFRKRREALAVLLKIG